MQKGFIQKISIFLCLFIAAGPLVYAGNMVPFNQQLRENIDSTFLVDGRFDSDKISSYGDGIRKRRNEITHIVTEYRSKYKKQSKKKIKKKLKEEKLLFIYNLILSYLDKIVEKQDSNALKDQLLLAQRVLELDYTSKVAGTEIPVTEAVSFAKNILKNYSIPRNSALYGEASNLVDPETGLYKTQEELTEMKNSGKDISLLEPTGNQNFWVKHNISEIDVEKQYFGGSKLYEGIHIKLPKDKAKFKKIRKTQTKPKVDVIYKVDGEKKTFKLKTGLEMHSEITASTLLSTLGFYTDISRYQKDFKLILPEDVSVDEFRKEWASYYKDYDFEKYAKEIGKTKKGNDYIIFHEVLIETKPEKLKRLGPWAYGSNGHRGLREVRGLLLFNMWIGNLDLKEADNNKLVLKDNGEGDYDFHYFQHDMGYSFGRFAREKAQEFEWNIIKGISDTHININFRNFQENSGFHHVTYDDARWMIRLIAQLTRKQITKSVALGGWPKEVQLLLVEKLIARRNQLVKAFGLSEEFEALDYDRNISTENGILNNGNLVKPDFKGYTQSFGNEMAEIFEKVFDAVEGQLVRAAIKTTEHFDSIVLDAESFGFDSSIVAEIEVTPNRTIRPNPKPLGQNDHYLVQDSIKVEFSLGAGLVARGKVSYFKEYKLVYPVNTKQDGLYNNGFIINALLPLHKRKGQLPENYVLILEDGFEGEGEVLLDIPGASMGFSKLEGINFRTVISRNDEEIKILKDRSNYSGILSRVYAYLYILRIPVWTGSQENGLMYRSNYVLKPYEKDNSHQQEIEEKFLEFLRTNNLNDIVNLAEVSSLQTNYVINRNKGNFLGLFKWDDHYRTDDLTQVVYEDNELPKEEKFYQVDIEEMSKWSLLGNGEVKEKSVRLHSKVNDGETLVDPVVDFKIVIEDKNTTTEELADHYLPFINKVALQKDFITFTPHIHTKNDLWGHSLVILKMMYNQEALDKLTEKPLKDYYLMMERTSNRDADFWKDKDVSYLKGREKTLKRKFTKLMKRIKAAKNAETDKEKYSHIVDAISNSVWKEGHSYNYLLIQRLNKIMGRSNHFIEGMVTMPENKEMRYPTRTPLYNVRNEKLKQGYSFFEFDFLKPEEIWEVFY